VSSGIIGVLLVGSAIAGIVAFIELMKP